MTPYDPDSEFSLTALSKLNEAGVPVLASLAKYHKQLAKLIGFQYEQYRHGFYGVLEAKIQDLLTAEEEVELVFTLWKEFCVKVRGLNYRDEVGTYSRYIGKEWLDGCDHPPTWRSLYDVLRELNMKELIWQIEETLQNSGKCLGKLLETLLSFLLTSQPHFYVLQSS